MQLIWPRIAFAVVALVVLGSVVDGTITFECDESNGECEGPLVLTYYYNADCSGTARARMLSSWPEEDRCFGDSVSGSGERYRCGNGEFQRTTWLNSTSCGGAPTYHQMDVTHMCRAYPRWNTSIMIICGPNDVDTPVTPPSPKRPNPSDPYTVPNQYCPNGVCRPGFASQAKFSSRSCNGTSYTEEVSSGVLGVCHQLNDTYFSYKVTCHESYLRSTTYAGTCDDAVVSTGVAYRRPGCSVVDRNRSGTEIYCPIISPDPLAPSLPPTLPGQASSMSLSPLLAILVILIATSISM